MNEKKYSVPFRDLSIKKEDKFYRLLLSWEMILIYILLSINMVLMITKPNLYFAQGTIQSIIQSGMDVSPIVLGMILVLMLGDIDVSAASIMIFSAMISGILTSFGAPPLIAAFIGIISGAICGAFNGFFVAYIKMPAVIMTISTQMLFRGIVKIILDVNVLKQFPEFYTVIGWKNILGLPISMILFFLMSILFVFILHKTKFGRQVYLIGNNAICAEYSGINVRLIKWFIFVIMGAMCGVGSIFFVGRMGGSVSSTMGTGYEMTAIAICVLGGISTNGGKGKVYGPVIATFIFSFLTYTLGLLDIDANSRKIVTGLILIIAILIPNLNKKLLDGLKLRFIYKNNKNIEALNIKTERSIAVLKEEIKFLKKKGGNEEKIKKNEEKILLLKRKCKEQTQNWLLEIEKEEKKSRKLKY